MPRANYVPPPGVVGWADKPEAVCTKCHHPMDAHCYCNYEGVVGHRFYAQGRCGWNGTVFVEAPERWWWPFGKKYLQERHMVCHCTRTPGEVKANWERSQSLFRVKVEI